jgi:hypothetical protein
MGRRRGGPGRWRVTGGRVGWWSLSLVLAACAVATGDAEQPVDRWQVWVCRVPSNTRVETYVQGLPGTDRAALDPVRLAGWFAEQVGPWFETVSYGHQRFEFVPGGVVQLGDTDGPEVCLERSIDGSANVMGPPGADQRAHGVLAVADAVHATTEPGGFGRAGRPCEHSSCTASETGRGAYVGAADFLPGWGELPLLDLVEHELGHALGWGHSGVSSTGGRLVYQSAIDLMSDSAALRTVDPDHRHGPPPLAVHRLAAGWIPSGDVVQFGQDLASSREVMLYPVSRPVGPRLLRLDLESDSSGEGDEWLAVEVLDDPLLAGLTTGVAVHRVGKGPLVPLVGEPPFTDVLVAGDRWTAGGWTVDVVGPRADEPGSAWTLTVRHDG